MPVHDSVTVSPLPAPSAGATPANDHLPPGFLLWVTRVVHEHRGRLLAQARRRGLDAQDALDAVQDAFVAFLRLPQARAIGEAPEDALKLLSVILQHDVLNRRRKRSRRAQALPRYQAELPVVDERSSDELIVTAEELARVHGCLARMGRLQRSVVTLSLLDEQPRECVAEILGISEGYVRVLLHRAREHIRSCEWEEDGDDDLAAPEAV